MKIKNRFCYKIEKSNLFIDEQGEDSIGYVMIKDICDESSKVNLQNIYKKVVASTFYINENNIYSITLDEYLNNTEEDDSGLEIFLDLELQSRAI